MICATANTAAVTAADFELQPIEGLRSMFEYAAAGMATALADGSLLQVNPAFCQFLGYSRTELLGLTVFDLTHPEDLERTRAMFQEALAGVTTSHQYRKRYVHKGGSPRWGLTTVTWVRNGSGAPMYCLGLIQDITQQNAAEAALQAREEIYRTLVENIDLGIALIDEHHQVLMVNSARARRFGRPAESFPEGHCFRQFGQGSRVCEDCPGVRALRTGRTETRTSEICLADGRKLITRIQAFPVFNAEGRADRFIEVYEDITEQMNTAQSLRVSQERLEFLAHYDPVTHLPNRFLLFDRLTQMMNKSRRKATQSLLLVVGLHRFKRINETLGHEAGDQLLAAVAARLQGCVRSSDTVARIAGSEFALVLEEVEDLGSVIAVATKILQACRQPITLAGQELFMAASLGISQYPEDGNAPGPLLKSAEVALARAKTEPGGGYRFYTSDMDARARELLEMESCLAKALKLGELLLHYQPLIDLKTGRMFGVEALMRWQRPGYGLVSPGDFIPLAESSGLMLPMGEWALRAACEQAVAWQRQGYGPLLMAVNISPRQFHLLDLAEQVGEVLRTTGMDPRWLEIEITESTIMEDLERAISTMQQINRLGVRLAIDDFGTGYSSLGALKLFPIHKLKVDQTFVRNLAPGSNDAAIAAAIIALAKSMNLEVIAEGIETEAQLAILRQQKCHQGQGYLFSRPIPAEQCTALLAQTGKSFFPARADKCGVLRTIPAGVGTRRTPKGTES
ncbi:MAG: putative bifunctional diguanylate cyclase/phosphodiesterase [Trichloromonadaceae bacterium]